MNILAEIMRRVEAQPLQAQQDLLAYLDPIPVESLKLGDTAALLQRVGTLDPIDAEEMLAAIDEV